ncbi:adenylyltransferase/cytidyltransferase family protein [Amycolatopsis sp. MtRt-6]|uniref:adenylyltransferase/cytidyltransferase family protein n=1 Tax=Amycolatopsis sp. MtRt-6 TaxID=2792782 RepID=UPI001A8F3EEA|nr:adenylyltransferase/cytidyltransferase family protein [Amycolatopsis sp. MtRt-6]
MAVYPIAVVHGRFQPLHVGHLEYLLAGKAACAELIVGITNPDSDAVVEEPTQPGRHRPEANPFTFYERQLMVDAALVGAGVPRSRFRIVPFPHSTPRLLRFYVPPDAVHLITIYDAWGEEKLRRLTAEGLRCEVLWRRRKKVTSGTEIRRRMAGGEDWQDLVPAGVAAVLKGLSTTRNLRSTHV